MKFPFIIIPINIILFICLLFLVIQIVLLKIEYGYFTFKIFMRSINNYKNVFNKRKKQPLEKFIIEVVYNLPGNKNAYYININGKFVGAYHEEVPGSARELAKHKLRGYANLFDMPAIKDSQILYVNTDYQK